MAIFSPAGTVLLTMAWILAVWWLLVVVWCVNSYLTHRQNMQSKDWFHQPAVKIKITMPTVNDAVKPNANTSKQRIISVSPYVLGM